MKNKKTRIKDRLTENKRKILTKEKTIYLISALIIIIAIATYIIWPFRYNIVISNEKEDFVLSSVEIVNHKGKIVSEEYGYNISTKLWKGEYKVSIKAKGYQDIDINIDNKIGPRFNKDISNEIKLKPKLINISTIRYTDPTEYLDLSPEMHAIGKNILGDLVDINYNHNEEIIYGDYMLYLSDPYFEADARLEGDVFYQDNVKRKKIRMSPNDKFIILNVDEIENIMNYMDDFLELSYDGVLSKSEKGFPRQFYLYKKDQIVSLGNMIFLSCQKRTFDVQNIQEDKRTYFVSKQQDIFRFVNESENIKECYADILKGEVPRKIGSEKISDVIYREVTREENTKDYEIGLLNSDKKGIDIGFTFDIESGRYVWEDDGLSISPCQDEDYSVGLESEEIVCDRPEFVA